VDGKTNRKETKSCLGLALNYYLYQQGWIQTLTLRIIMRVT